MSDLLWTLDRETMTKLAAEGGGAAPAFRAAAE
jgi:hypothetical protein